MRGCLLAVLITCFELNAQKADIRVDVGLVTVTCSVTDRANAPAKNLRAEDFILRDNGKAQKIDHLWQEADLPLTIGLIVDISGSQAAFISQHHVTVSRFLSQVIGPKDRAFLVAVGPEVRLVTDLTGSIDELRRGVDRLESPGFGQPLGEPCNEVCGGTALWNGLYAAANQKMHWIRGRKALIVLSDGIDTGSIHKLRDAIESVQEAETVVYAIKYVDPSELSDVAVRKRDLERLTDETGGYTFPHPDDLGKVFSQIEDDLRNLYVIAFTPPESARDGRFHKLEVRMSRKDLVVRARNGYYSQ